MTTRSPLSRRTDPRRGGFLKGCLIALAVMAVIGILVGIYVAMHLKTWAAQAAKAVARSAVEQSQLSDDQKKRIVARIDSLADDFESDKITMEQMAQVFEEIGKSPLLHVAMVKAAEEKYIKPSALSAEEKAAGVRSLERLARGVHENSIPQEALQEVLDPIEATDANGQKQLKEQVTTDELKAFLAAAKKRADDAKVPDEAFTVDVAGELEKAIDRALSKPPGGK